jgi:hypothetical protein
MLDKSITCTRGGGSVDALMYKPPDFNCDSSLESVPRLHDTDKISGFYSSQISSCISSGNIRVGPISWKWTHQGGSCAYLTSCPAFSTSWRVSGRMQIPILSEYPRDAVSLSLINLVGSIFVFCVMQFRPIHLRRKRILFPLESRP